MSQLLVSSLALRSVESSTRIVWLAELRTRRIGTTIQAIEGCFNMHGNYAARVEKSTRLLLIMLVPVRQKEVPFG
jgi:hypothetical protein